MPATQLTMEIHHIHPKQQLEATEALDIIRLSKQLELSVEALSSIKACREFLDESLAKNNNPVYGINTGFGALCDKAIGDDDLETLQRNLLLSHACGAGDEIPHELVKLMLLLKIHALSLGHSGVGVVTVQRLVDFFNLDMLPVVYELGSLGASGDLAPLAHLALPLIGRGEVYFKGKKMRAADALKDAGLAPLKLKSKEGLALINGTQFMNAYAVWCCSLGVELLDKSLLVSAMSLDAFDGRIEPFSERIARIRPQQNVSRVSEQIRRALEGSEIIKQEKKHVQDPYSFRCIPQVMGAVYHTLDHALHVVNTEINSVTDNPIIFPETGEVISGGNFHGEPLALALDFLAIALAEAGSISERRTYKLISGQRGLPHFLVKNAGLNSGFMIPQYTAASMVSQNKQLCTPASVDTIDSSNGQEDHVSMGANAATKCLRVLHNLQRIIGIELFTAAQALDFRKPLKSSPAIEKLHAQLRAQVPFIENDVYMREGMEKAGELVTGIPKGILS